MRPLMRGLVYLIVPLSVAAWIGLKGSVDVAAIVLTVAVLLVSVVTLLAVTPQQAQLIVQRQKELGLDDLIFYGSADQETPRDFLLQLHVAVANIGGRKGVLSRLDLEELRDSKNKPVKPLDMPFPIAAQVFRQTMSYRTAGGVLSREYVNEIGGPPLTLDADDVVTMRFRCRRGIDWDLPRWDLGEIKKLVESVERKVVKARIKATYRRGTRIVTSHHEVSIETVKQAEWVARIMALTSNLTQRPDIPKQPFDIE